jgi:hypothetical protein
MAFVPCLLYKGTHFQADRVHRLFLVVQMTSADQGMNLIESFSLHQSWINNFVLYIL